MKEPVQILERRYLLHNNTVVSSTNVTEKFFRTPLSAPGWTDAYKRLSLLPVQRRQGRQDCHD